MKKMIFLIAVLSVLGFASGAMAAANDAIGSGQLTVGGTGGTPTLTFGFSPKVVGRYYTNGTNQGTAQWFAIATAHPGGNEIYATAQDLTNLYHQSFTTGTAIDSTLLALPATPESAESWSEDGWVQ